MKPTPHPSEKYPRARKPVAGAYSMPTLRLPGMSSMNMPRRAMGRKTGQVPQMKKLRR